MEEQIERAVNVAYDPNSDNALKVQAFDFINQLRSSREGWSLCLSLALRREPAPPSEVVRHVSLDLLNQALKAGQLGENDVLSIFNQVWGYVKGIYGESRDGLSTTGVTYAPDSASIQNKLTQTLTFLFTIMYENLWPDFFSDIMQLSTLAVAGASIDQSSNTTSSQHLGTVMYIKILTSVHDEIADMMVPKDTEESRRDTKLKDMIRDRDVRRIATSWQAIISHSSTPGTDYIIDICLGCIGRWVSWIDVSLVLNEQLLVLLIGMLNTTSATGSSERGRRNTEVAINTFIEIISKKMSAADKLEVIRFLRVDEAVAQLLNGQALSQMRHTSEYDTDLAEDVAKLVNTTVLDLVKAIESLKPGDAVMLRAFEQLKTFLPHVLRLLSDEYDEICSTVIPCLTEVLNYLRKQARSGDRSQTEIHIMLPTILDVILSKVKYDDTAVWGSEDTQTDEAELQELRKRLHTLQQSIAAIDENMYIEKIMSLVLSSLDNFKRQNGQLDWREIELALTQLYLFGDLAVKGGGLYSKTRPITPAAERLIHMMYKLMETDISASAHPAVSLEYMEICVRYYAFFDANPQFITRVLEHFVAFARHDKIRVRLRSWYLLQRFVRHVRMQIGNIAGMVTQALASLLPIHAEVASTEDGADNDDDSSNDGGESADARFTSQLYLYETIGVVTSVKAVPLDTQVILMQGVTETLFRDIEANLGPAAAGDKLALMQVHHLIMALGNLARGFTDIMPGTMATAKTSRPADAISEQFSRLAEVTLVALESLKCSVQIREAARFAFSRYIGVMGSQVLMQLPRWIDGLLTAEATRDEMALFMRLLEQVIFAFKVEIYNILNTLLSPFLHKVFGAISETASGTDDEIQLAELKREYLAFISVILNNDLESVLVSPENQPIFGHVISTIEQLTRDLGDCPTAKLAFTVLIRMTKAWGGPDVVAQSMTGTTQESNSVANGISSSMTNPGTQSTKPKLDGFDQFMMTRFSPLCWTLPSSPTFNAKDAQSRQVLAECAALQKAIYAKTGPEYVQYLQTVELNGMGMQQAAIQEYTSALEQMDLKAFQTYFKTLVSNNTRR